MKYPYTLWINPGYSTHLILPDEVGHFGDCISEIRQVEVADEILELIDDVTSGKMDEFEFTLNAPSVIIRPKISIAYNDFAANSDEIHEMETEEFQKLVVMWKEHLINKPGNNRLMR